MLLKQMHEEMDRCRDLRKMYVEIGPVGSFGVMTIDMAIKRAEKSIEDDDVVEMLKSFEELKTIEG